MRRSLGSILAACVLLLVPASCGDKERGNTATESATATSADAGVVVRRYFAAFARGDGRAACALMTSVGRRGLQQLPEGERARSCERAVAELQRNLIPVREALVRDLRVSGRQATARVTSDDPPYEGGIVLNRDAGGWKIAFPPALVTRFDSPPGIRAHDDEPHEGE